MIDAFVADPLVRAVIALVGLYALPSTEAVYFTVMTDASGKPLTGASTYRLHFPAASLPPLEPTGFWSITMYDASSRFLVDNPIDRYAINSSTPGLVRNEDGSLDIYIQHAAPTGHESNWLPAPTGGFYVVLRTYLPKQEVRDGTWTPPTLVTVS